MPRRDTAARRYAEAAFQLGREEGTLDDWERDLQTLAAALQNDELRRVLEHPAVTFRQKEKVLRAALPRMGEEPLNLILLLVRRGRPAAIHPMLARFTELLRRERGVVLAQVRTALPLDDEQRSQIIERLRAMTGEKVEVSEAVDESLIGGVAVRIGDQLYDASVRSRLERLRARLTAV